MKVMMKSFHFISVWKTVFYVGEHYIVLSQYGVERSIPVLQQKRLYEVGIVT
jgi:hypothetical protein